MSIESLGLSPRLVLVWLAAGLLVNLFVDKVYDSLYKSYPMFFDRNKFVIPVLVLLLSVVVSHLVSGVEDVGNPMVFSGAVMGLSFFIYDSGGWDKFCEVISSFVKKRLDR